MGKKGNIFFPYLKAPDRYFRSGSWINASGIAVADKYPEWDCNTRIEISKTVTLDIGGIWRDCMLGDKDVLRLIPVWHCKETSLRGCGKSFDIRYSSDLKEYRLELSMEGSTLAGNIMLKAQLTLLSAGNSSPNPLAPCYPGSILWEDIKDVSLGKGTRFPTTITDFSSIGRFPDEGGWILDWCKDDLHQNIYSGLMLYINSHHKRIFKAIMASNTGQDAEDRAILSCIYFDVGRTMIAGALGNDEFIEDREEYEDGSIGCAIRRLLSSMYRGDLRQLRDMTLEKPEEFNCLLQDRLKLLPSSPE